MKKIVLTVVAAMTMTFGYAKTQNTTAVKNVDNYGITFDMRRLAGKVVDLAITLAAWFICGILIIPTLIRKLKKHLNDETLIILSTWSTASAAC